MKRSFLIDTSVLHGVPARKLETVAGISDVAVSPYTVWELLTHLSDSDFDRAKGYLMKLRHVRILDDPRASIEKLVTKSSDRIHTRVPDSDLAYAMLAALRGSSSVPEFYGVHIRDENGELHQVSGCIERVRETLATEEQRFKEFLTVIVASVRGGRVALGTSAERHAGASDVILGLWRQLGARVAGTAPNEEFIRASYVYASYVVHRSAALALTGAQPDGNDFEDAEICRHLWIGSETAFVTADRILRCTSANAVATWEEQRGERARLSVCDVAGFTA